MRHSKGPRQLWRSSGLCLSNSDLMLPSLTLYWRVSIRLDTLPHYTKIIYSAHQENFSR